jgi:hypothetical protein
MSQEKLEKTQEMQVAIPDSFLHPNTDSAIDNMNKRLFGLHSYSEEHCGANWVTFWNLGAALAMPVLGIFLYNGFFDPTTPDYLIFLMKLAAILTIVPFAGFAYFGLKSLRYARILQSVKRNKMPTCVTSKGEEMVVLSIILAREYNKLRSRWVRYLDLCNTGACTCSIDRDQMNTRLAAMKKEIENTMAIANAYTAMVDAGDFDEMPSGNLIADHLEHARDLQESINREVSGVNHAMIAPLHVEARMADAQEEVREAIRTSATCVNPDDEKKRKAQQQAARLQAG